MKEEVSVDKALARGQHLVMWPAAAIFVVPAAIVIFLVREQQADSDMLFYVLAGGLVLAWLYRCIAITPWRIWAFSKVRNVHELKHHALKERLIWREGSFADRTEIRTAADNQKLAELERKFEIEDVFNDDLNVPDETVIGFAKGRAVIEAGAGILFICIGCMFLFPLDNEWYYGVIPLAIGVYFAYTGIRKLMMAGPGVIINANGMETYQAAFATWKDIAGEDVIRHQAGEHVNRYLTYRHPSGIVEINISDLGISYREMEKLLRLYRGRYSLKSKQVM